MHKELIDSLIELNRKTQYAIKVLNEQHVEEPDPMPIHIWIKYSGSLSKLKATLRKSTQLITLLTDV